MKKPNSLLKQLVLSIAASVGLAYFSWQMLQDVGVRGDKMTFSMWIAIGVMLLGAVYGFHRAWKLFQRYQAEQPAYEVLDEEAPQAKVPEERHAYVPTGDMEDGADTFVRLIIGNRGLIRLFKKGTYPATFESYCCQLDEPLAYLRETEEVHTLAEMVLDRLEQNWKEVKSKTPDFTDQILISVYLMPALIKAEEPDAMDFAKAFRDCWKERYPKSAFEIGTYEQICRGFEKKFGCFITTAVCQSQGKSDDCYELTQFRHFRDEWLANQPDGQNLINRYYDIAPSIVNIINLQANAPAIYRQIKEDYLDPCLKAIEQKNNQDCLARYKSMVESLSLQYGL